MPKKLNPDKPFGQYFDGPNVFFGQGGFLFETDTLNCVGKMKT